MTSIAQDQIENNFSLKKQRVVVIEVQLTSRVKEESSGILSIEIGKSATSLSSTFRWIFHRVATSPSTSTMEVKWILVLTAFVTLTAPIACTQEMLFNKGENRRTLPE
jgi:hypothetical protein